MPTATVNTNGRAIRNRRIVAGFTTRTLAAKAGISQGYLTHIERGERYGTPPVLKRIADALACSVADIVDLDAA